MILIVATNPTVDRTIDIPVLTPHAVHRSTHLELSAGGKGLNVGRAASGLGLDYITAGFLGGDSGRLLERLAAAENIKTDWLRFEGIETKMSHLLRHEDGDSTVINEPGPSLSPVQWKRLCDFIAADGRDADAAVLAGSVPPGVEASSYLELCRRLVEETGNVLVDTPGATLEAAVANPEGLSIKVNSDELGEALGQHIFTAGQAELAAEQLIRRGAAMVCVTMGADGAVAVDSTGAWKCSCSVSHVVSSVGSGDSFSAGLCLRWSGNLPLPEALSWAAACGAANAETELPACFTKERVKEILPSVELVKIR